jgi:large subunit ribosomal protein L10
MLRTQKEALLEEIRSLLAEHDAMFVSDYRGLTVAQITQLRDALRPTGSSLHVLKNTLTRRAAQESGREALTPLLSGPTAVTFCGDDPVAAAKALSDFARKHDTLVVRGGLLQGQLIQPESVKALATLPPREVLVAQVLGTMVAPISGLVTVLNGTIAGFVRALSQIADQKSAAA